MQRRIIGYLATVNLDFRRGDRVRPRGHALTYFEAADGRVFAVYLVVPPIAIELGKYMPPMFAAHMPMPTAVDVTAMPLPPIPEEIKGGNAELERLADLRDDDLIAGGSIDPTQLDRMLMLTAEAGQSYVALYKAYVERASSATPPPEEPSYAVEDVLLSLMGEGERIEKIARLVGQLRYAVGGDDAALADETVAEMERIGRHLAEKYRFPDILAAARRPGDEGGRLTQLYLERCYKLSREEYADVARIEAEIKRLSA